MTYVAGPSLHTTAASPFVPTAAVFVTWLPGAESLIRSGSPYASAEAIDGDANMKADVSKEATRSRELMRMRDSIREAATSAKDAVRMHRYDERETTHIPRPWHC